MNNIRNDASSDYALTNYLKRGHMLVEPREYLLDSAGQCGSYHYVPILEVLGKLLSHGDIYSHLHEKPDPSMNYTGYSNACLFQNDPFLSNILKRFRFSFILMN